MTLPAFCRVEATARPTSDSDIKFEVWIPPAEAWNGKFEGVGNGGYSGAIGYAAMAIGLRRGYAVASTDTGHSRRRHEVRPGPSGKSDRLGLPIGSRDDRDVEADRPRSPRAGSPSTPYFVGCSSGGHQALSEAQRYPEDYDGIVAGDPANNRIRQTFAFLHSWIATHDKDGKPIIPQTKLALLTKAAVEACDGIDGLKDGLIDDPRRCHFDPAKLLCKGADEPTCLTAAQVESAKKIYDGVEEPAHRRTDLHRLAARQRRLRRRAGTELARLHHGPAGADARRLLQVLPLPRSELGLPLDRLGTRPRLRRAEDAVHGRRRQGPDAVQEARRQAADVHRLVRSRSCRRRTRSPTTTRW